MKINYQLTHLELARALSLLGVPTVGAWLVYLVVASAMFPSIILFASIGAETCLTWFGVMLISILIASAWAYWKRTGYAHPFAESMEFSDDLLVYRFSHSRVESRWSEIDRVEDFPDHFRIYFHGRPIFLPKRVLGDRALDCQVFLQRIANSENSQSASREEASRIFPPIGLFEEMIPQGITPLNQYQVSQLDLEQAVQEKFTLITTRSATLLRPRQPTRPMWLNVASLCLLWLAFGGLTFLVSRLSDRRVTMEIVVLISLGWFLPIVWLLVWRKFSWLFRARIVKHKVRDTVSTLTLTPTGWVIANPTSGTIGHWKDLQFILQSEHFIGMRMINQLVYLIPKRVFSSTKDMDDFLEQSLQFQQLHRATATDPTLPMLQKPVIETHNPYQPPQN